MDIREPVSYGGLKVGIAPSPEEGGREIFLTGEKPDLVFTAQLRTEGREIFLTGEKPLFRASVENSGTEERKGVAIFVWKLGEYATLRPIVFDVPGKSTKNYDLPREWLCQPGTAIYRLNLSMENPERLLREFEEYKGSRIREEGSPGFIPPEVRKRDLGGPFHILCQYRVWDRVTFKHEEELRKEDRNRVNIQNRLAWTQAALTCAICFMTVVMLLRTLGIL